MLVLGLSKLMRYLVWKRQRFAMHNVVKMTTAKSLAMTFVENSRIRPLLQSPIFFKMMDKLAQH